MILKVPEYKKLKLGSKGDNLYIRQLNEDIDSTLEDGIDLETIQKVMQWLNYYGVMNYNIKAEGGNVLVDVEGNLYLSNKNLSDIRLFKFDKVTGTCNMSGNEFTDFSCFPRYIGGDCIANFNYISDFTDAPKEIRGQLLAKKQKKGTYKKYLLTDENYRKYQEGILDENCVYLVNEDKYGEIVSIDEELGLCNVMLVENEEIKPYKLDEVDCLAHIQNLLS